MIAVSVLLALGAVGLNSEILREREFKRMDDARRRRESMRLVAERWHFRQWGRDLSS